MSAAPRYAKALYQLAVSAKAVPVVVAQAAALHAALAEKTVADALSNPGLSAERRLLLAESMAKAVKAHQLLADTLRLMASNNRLPLVPEMLKSIETLSDNATFTARATVESATPLTEAQRTLLAAKIKAFTNASQVVMEEKTKPSLMGGFRAYFKGQVWDTTVAGNLARLRQQLADAIHKVSND